MAFGLYKPGQGYWVRVLTATVMGVVTLLGCAWLWNQLESYTPPVREWTATVQGLAQVAAGTPVELRLENTPEGPGSLIARGVATGIDITSAGGHLHLKDLIVEPTFSIDRTKKIVLGAGGGAESKIAAVSSVVAIPSFDKIYIQAVGVGILMLAATLFGFWFIGTKPSSSEFLIATDGEMKKVNWSSRKDIIGSTQVVVMWCVLLAAGLFLVDTLFAKFFNLINVLQY
jgi:preprotein translocase SecE subunit